jgi:hypothetical protein
MNLFCCTNKACLSEVWISTGEAYSSLAVYTVLETRHRNFEQTQSVKNHENSIQNAEANQKTLHVVMFNVSEITYEEGT